MNVLFVSIAWPSNGERNLYSDLMMEFASRSHNIFVLSADEKTDVSFAGKEKGINILKVKTLPVRKVNKFRKALALISLDTRLRREAFKHWSDIKMDLIISHSPPVTFSGLLKSLKKKFNAPIYYLLKDIWPHGPADLKIIRRFGMLYFYFRIHEKRMYRIADFIGCMSPMNKDYILKNNRFLHTGKVEVCPNTITPRPIIPKESRAAIRSLYNIPENAIVFIFSGNIGKAHGMSFYLDAIQKLSDNKKAFFLIGGGGQFFNYVLREIEMRRLSNIGTYKRLSAEDFDQLLLASDVGVILLDSGYTVPQFPSRILAYLEAKKPVLCSVNRHTDIGSIVESSGCGISTVHGDMDAFLNAVEYFCDEKNATSMSEMGMNSFSLLNREYTSAVSYRIIARHFIK